MGPVDDPSGERGDKNAYSFASGGSFKKLYRIREGAIIKGVCAGIAAYFNADPTLVRILFIALSLMSGGGALIAYILMAVFIPYANTPEERSAASSQPFNAHELIARAKAGYYSFKNKK
jgi:phage shock protein C